MRTALILISIVAFLPRLVVGVDTAEEASRRVGIWLRAQQTGICELHRSPMAKKTVPIIYGI
ncbi:MAG: hypothetical protein EOP84_17660, partial [Verrucomicrobiaceae bacterium]